MIIYRFITRRIHHNQGEETRTFQTSKLKTLILNQIFTATWTRYLSMDRLPTHCWKLLKEKKLIKNTQKHKIYQNVEHSILQFNFSPFSPLNLTRKTQNLKRWDLPKKYLPWKTEGHLTHKFHTFNLRISKQKNNRGQ